MAAQRFELTQAPGEAVQWGYHLTRSGAKYVMSAPDGVILASPGFKEHEAAFDAVGELDETLPKIRARKDLSEFGKADKLEGVSITTLSNLAVAAAKVDDQERGLNATEAEFYAPSSIEPTDVASALMDSEIRNWFRSHKDMAQVSLVQKLEPRAQEALLRSPVPLYGAVREILQAQWREAKAAQDPQKVENIAHGRRQVEWGRRALLQLASVTANVVGLPRNRLLYMLTNTTNADALRGLHVFGFGREEVSKTQEHIARDGLRRAA